MVTTNQKERDYVNLNYEEEKPKYLLLQAVYRREMVEDITKWKHMQNLRSGEWYIITFKDGSTKRYKLP